MNELTEVEAQAREILNRHLEYTDGLSRGQITMRTSNALAAVEEALASRTSPDLDLFRRQQLFTNLAQLLDEVRTQRRSSMLPWNEWHDGLRAEITRELQEIDLHLSGKK